ncbi:MAG: thiamine-binding protein [Chitinophagaceae bacterium]
MHQHIINASLQVVPIVLDKHPYDWVDEAIAIIQQSGVKYEIGPFATVVEGAYDEVLQLIHQVNDRLQSKGCAEWILNVQLQMRCNSDITGDEKTAKFLV